MSDTPRTDAVLTDIETGRILIVHGVTFEALEILARQLERELAAANAERDTLRAQRDRLAEALKKTKSLLLVAKCPNCDGSGGIPRLIRDREYVTREMALDAGDPSLEDSLYSEEEWELEQCQWCDERNAALAAVRGE